MSKYKDSLYPDKINDLIDNDGNLSEEAKGNLSKDLPVLFNVENVEELSKEVLDNLKPGSLVSTGGKTYTYQTIDEAHCQLVAINGANIEIVKYSKSFSPEYQAWLDGDFVYDSTEIIDMNEFATKNYVDAQKNILSNVKVDYNEDDDETTYTFPKGIVPIKFYNNDNDNYLYCDYESLRCKYQDGSTEYSITTDREHIKFIVGGEYSVYDIFEEVQYILVDRDFDAEYLGNWHAILNPLSRPEYNIIDALTRHDPLADTDGTVLNGKIELPEANQSSITRTYASEAVIYQAIAIINQIIDRGYLYVPGIGGVAGFRCALDLQEENWSFVFELVKNAQDKSWRVTIHVEPSQMLYSVTKEQI